MSRIDTTFARLRAANRPGLVPFVTCGDPSVEGSVALLHALVEGGADVIELGVPFSDPQADGPVIQRSSERALARKVGLRTVLDVCRRFREADAGTPLVLMGYLNPVELYGVERFGRDAQAAGVDGLLLVDCPPEESDALAAALAGTGIQRMLLAAPTTDDARLQSLATASEGYLYYVSFAGVTGAAKLRVDDIRQRVTHLRTLGGAPVAVGFGVRDAESAAAIGAFADAVVVGSALVETLSTAPDTDAACRLARDFLRPLRAALDAAR